VLLLLLGACRIGFEPTGEALTPADANLGPPDGSERCPRGRGPDMSLVPAGFCVDNTEVTKAHYDEFLRALEPVKTDGRCAFNTTYQARDYVWAATTNPDQAVAGIDWCDARDFCAWAGKRLCGRIGGGALAYAEHAAPDAQWYAACSQGVGRAHPYGTAADDTAQPWCHLDGTDGTPGQQAVVGSYPRCKLEGTNVFDLLGNVQEWTDACETSGADPAADRCKVVGGVWYFGSSYTDCGFADPSGGAGIPRSAAEKHTGVRCCPG